MKSTLVAIALVLGATGAVSMNLASAGPATGGAAPSSPGFGQLDANANGHITMDEMKGDKKMMSKSKMLDKNKDDKISESEFGAFSKGSTGGRAGLGAGGRLPSQ